MNRFGLWLLTLSGIQGAASIAAAEQQLPPPNIVIFLADDMGMGDTSALQDWSGNDDSVQLHTPAMDRLARMGVRFTDAHSPHSRCTTTRYALLTGRYCWRTRLKHWVLFGVHGEPLIESSRVTLPKFLRAQGYRTGMVGKWHLGLTYRQSDGTPAAGWADADLRQPLVDCPVDHGFDFFYGHSRSHKTSGPNALGPQNRPDQKIGPGWIMNRRVIGATDQGKQLDGSYAYNRVGNVLDREALGFLTAAAAETKPFFLYFASPSNHAPHTPSEAIGDRPVVGASRFVDGRPCGTPRHDFIYQNDVHIQRLLEFLEQKDDPRRPGHKLLGNTLFIFASDNGAEITSKVATGPLRSNKGSLYEGGHRIPLLVSWPAGQVGDGNDNTPGVTCDNLIGLNDLFATVAEVLDAPLPPVEGEGRGAEDSVSRLAAMRGSHSPRNAPVYPNDHREASKKLADRRAWVAVRSNVAPLPGSWKLMLNHRFAFDGKIVPQELYELGSDPTEQLNRLSDPTVRPVLEFLTEQAEQAAGDGGNSRQPSVSN